MVLWLNLAATLYMTGLIWFVQVVHYPLFDSVGRNAFAGYEARHKSLTSRVVVAPMVLELLTAAWLVFEPGTRLGRPMAAVLLALVALCWASTFVFQVPAHDKLSRGFDPTAHARLVSTNWLRTAAWTTRSALLLYLLSP